ncbi:MAG TPA: creatininase family protein [Armatimonadota bacterium]|jgi:creatinine amidohydrolase
MSNVRYHELLPQQIVAAREACPLAYVPLGGIEWHGEHLAVGNDALKAEVLAVRCAEARGGLAFPPLWWGEPREAYLMDANAADRVQIDEKMGLPPENLDPGYMGRSPHETDRAYIELLVHLCRQLRSLGFRVVTLIAGHYPLRHHALAAAEWFNVSERGHAQAWGCCGYELVRDQIPWAGDHAGRWETALLMALRPECVDLSRLPADPNAPLIGVGTGAHHPALATAEDGEAGVQAVVATITARAHELLANLP